MLEEQWCSLIRSENPRKGPRTCQLSRGQGHKDTDRGGHGPPSLGRRWTFGPHRIHSGGDLWSLLTWTWTWHFFGIHGCLRQWLGLWAGEHEPAVGGTSRDIGRGLESIWIASYSLRQCQCFLHFPGGSQVGRACGLWAHSQAQFCVRLMACLRAVGLPLHQDHAQTLTVLQVWDGWGDHQHHDHLGSLFQRQMPGSASLYWTRSPSDKACILYSSRSYIHTLIREPLASRSYLN